MERVLDKNTQSCCVLLRSHCGHKYGLLLVIMEMISLNYSCIFLGQSLLFYIKYVYFHCILQTLLCMVSAEICDCINRLVVSIGGHAKSSYALNGVAGARKRAKADERV